MTLARPADYWFSNYAIFIQLNATGDSNYIHANCSSGSVVMCYMRGIPGLGYDNAHNYRRWPLVASPTVFHDNLARYVYIAIPKSADADAVAQVVFPSEMIDIYGCNESGTQVGPDTYFYIFTQGIISPSEVAGVVQDRTWQQVINSGQLASDESIAAGGSDSWWEYIASSDMVKFLKTISEATFKKLTAAWASVTQLVLNEVELNSVASEKTKDDAKDAVVTPAYAHTKFLSKTKADRAKGKITFEDGIRLGNDEKLEIDKDGNAELVRLLVRHALSDPNFRQGFTGQGWKIWLEDELAKMELDELTVRHVMHIFEFIIQKIRSVGGQIIVSAANGKVKIVEDLGSTYKMTFEGDNYFQPSDLMRCQTFTGDDIRGYWVEISQIGKNYVVVSKSEFNGVMPREGDEVVLMGNTTNAKRQNLISISATEDGEPRIDVIDGVHEKNFTGCLRARLGNLDGIQDDWFPKDNQPHGNGLYADNAYLRGTFLLTTGEDIKTKFEIVEGKIQSAIESVSQGFLSNPSFSDGLNKWTGEDVVFFLFGTKWIWANNNALSGNGGIEVVNDNGRNAVIVRHGAIVQKFGDLSSLPEIRTNEDGKKEPATVSLSFMYKVTKKGHLFVNFKNQTDDVSFVEHEPFYFRKELEVSDEYKQMTITGLWDGTGDFSFLFTGEIYVSMLVLSDDRIGSLTQTYKTLFEQSDKLVQISAAMFGDDKTLLEKAGLVVKPNGAGLYAFDANGGLAQVGAYTEDGTGMVLLKGDKIRLEGAITANGNLEIRKDGSIEANNGTFRGDGCFSGFVKRIKTVISPDNIGTYAKWSSADNYYVIDYEKTGPYIMFEGDFSHDIPIYFSGVWDGYSELEDELEGSRSFIGTQTSVYNHTNNSSIILIGFIRNKNGDLSQPVIDTAQFSLLECVCDLGTDGYERIYWTQKITGLFKETI